MGRTKNQEPEPEREPGVSVAEGCCRKASALIAQAFWVVGRYFFAPSRLVPWFTAAPGSAVLNTFNKLREEDAAPSFPPTHEELETKLLFSGKKKRMEKLWKYYVER